MDLILKAIIMGIVEGVTEFIPVSSTGHLIIAGFLLNFKGDFALVFEVFIQFGAILAILFLYRRKIINSLKNMKPSQSGFNLWAKVFIAFLPAAALGFILKDFIQEQLFSTEVVSFALIAGAILMLIVEKYLSSKKIENMEQLSYKQALFIGLFQCMALLPGMSRSASTIIGGLLIGMSLAAAAEFSFFLAIPTMLGASVLSLFEGISEITTQEWIALAIGFVVSFIVAIIIVRQFVSFLTKHKLTPFAYYRLALGIIILTLLLTKSMQTQ